ncbi:MAG: arsenosugar biosynthesis radical SAM (seleno)protein ArsS [Nitrospirota bacterium]
MISQTVFWAKDKIKKGKINVIQVNVGNVCNQMCSHCHIGGSPYGELNMDFYTAEKILKKIMALNIENIEFTGGAPEMNPNLKMFIENLSLHKKITVRTNLTILDLPQYSFFIDLYKKHRVRIIASLPSVFEDLTDKQRGKGVFKVSIKVLERLNDIGYGGLDLPLDLVYNCIGDYLPPEQTELEKEYREILKDSFEISFNDLLTIVNVPIKRFRQELLKEGRLHDYMKLLLDNFNPDTLGKVMCKHLISVDYSGHLHDCDFNLALGIRIKDYEGKKFWEIDFDSFNPEITCDEHCYACTVNRGSSCQGILIKDNSSFDVKKSVKEYYGKVLRSSDDLKTSCCTSDAVPERIRKVLPYIAEEVKMKYYGCGSPIPSVLTGLRVLDLGCGTGRDTYVMSKLVGEEGFVFGIDMTENQIEVARKYIDRQAEQFGYKKPNVGFIFDYIENIGKHFPEESLDLIISNCVLNLVEDKEDVMGQVYRILKFGGEFYFSDIYADRRLPEDIRKNPILYSECLGGALYYRDFEGIVRKAGFLDPRVVSKRVVDIRQEEIGNLTGNITFYSITYRLWKLKGLEYTSEDYGHNATYKGGIVDSPVEFELDCSDVFLKNKNERICGNTALMLSETRFKDYFIVTGNFDRHLGEFKGRKKILTVTDKSISCC